MSTPALVAVFCACLSAVLVAGAVWLVAAIGLSLRRLFAPARKGPWE